MAEKFLMPKLSPTMEEGQISRWVKNEGDSYDSGETLAEVDTDKATMEMTALSGGTLLKILKGAGETALLGEVIAIIGQAGEDISALLTEVSTNGSQTKPPATEEPKTETPARTASPVQSTASVDANVQAGHVGRAGHAGQSGQPDNQANGRLIVSPIAARMAAENGVDLKSISGSGPNGRIIKRDIEAAIDSGGAAAKAQPARTFVASTVVGASAFTDEPTSKMRQIIASRLAESIGPIPIFYLTVEKKRAMTPDLRSRASVRLT